MQTVTLSEDMDIERVEEWCALHGVDATWKPTFVQGKITAWQTSANDDDAMLLRLMFGYEKSHGTAVAPSSSNVTPFRR